MRKWTGILANTDATGDAPVFISNGRFYIEGELQRRRGLVKFAAQGGNSLGVQFHPSAGSWVVYAKSDGTLESVVLT